MNLTRRELLQRMTILAASLPLARLPDVPNSINDVQDTVEINLVHSAVRMYSTYPNVATGWICNGCQGENTYCSRKCETCGVVEAAIPEQWTCPDCEKTQVWESCCSCYNVAQGVEDSKINPFWLG